MGKTRETQSYEPRPIAAASTAVTAFVGGTRQGPLDRPVQVNSMAEFTGIFGGLWHESPLSFALQHFFENGGQTAIVVRIASANATETTTGRSIDDSQLVPPSGLTGQQGIYLLEQVANFDVMVIPPFAWDHDPASSTWAAAADYCLRRRAFLLIDPPASSATATIDAHGVGLAALTKSLPQSTQAACNAAFYVPRIEAKNPLTGQPQSFAPSGSAAGILARTDAASGVWVAPAGSDATVVGATSLERELATAEISTLAALGINALRTLPGGAPVVWGARTLQGADGLSTEWRYLPIRRLALFLEKSIEQGTRWATFEENDEKLWVRIRNDVGEFLQALFRRGAFQGQSPRDAYVVRCGPDTITQRDIENGILNIQVGFAPVRPAEFVTISIRQRAGHPDD